MTAETQTVPASIFRAYDIRGIVDDTLTEPTVELIGRAIGSEAAARGESTVVVARDGRLSGPRLRDALVRGLTAAGRDVIDVGMVPTPVLYFATHALDGTASGVMVTGSHNPPDYNGFKIVLSGETLSGEAITALHTRIVENELADGQGSVREVDVRSAYLARILSDVRLARPLKAVVDCGNGVAGELGPQLIETLGAEMIPLFAEIDGTFPNHHPDPGKPENLVDLIRTVQETGADIGLAFDGDGDRLGVVSASGDMVWPDRILGLFLGEVLGCAPGAAVVFDVKSTRQLFRGVRQYGGRPVMAPSGHSVIKARMAEENAVLGAEMTGHFFFADRWYGFDDALYAAARLAAVVARTPGSNPFLALAGGIATPEIHLPLPRAEARALVADLAAHPFPEDWERVTVDGLRLDAPGGWALIRVSNTRDALVLRFEADDEAALAALQGPLREALTAALPAGTALSF